jgi:predicted acetyltransferase
MDLQIRPARPDEMDQFYALIAYVFNGNHEPDRSDFRPTPPDWTLCGFVDGRMVTTFATIPFTARFNGVAAKLGGVSAVGTRPEYRRQGIMGRIMRQAIAEMRDRGQFVAALWASQAAIYQRYGFALATHNMHYTLDPADIHFTAAAPREGTCQRYHPEDGLPIIKQVYTRFVEQRTLALHRSDMLWTRAVLSTHPADGPNHIVVYTDAADVPQGYMVYTLRRGQVDHAARSQELVIRDIGWLTPEAYLALWHFIAKHDLVGRARAIRLPADDPTPAFVQEPRLLHATLHEGIWLRLTDVVGALEARGYVSPGHLIIEVEGDDIADWNNGVVQVETDGVTTRVTPSRLTPEIRLGAAALAALYSGHRTAHTLANWGLLRGDARALTTAGQLFQTRYAPHCPDHF